MFKRICSIILASTLSLSLSACGGGGSTQGNVNSKEKFDPSQYVDGAYVMFGSYEQDNNTADGQEPIEWLVKEVYGNEAELISTKALELKQFDSRGQIVKDLFWENSELRKWLNEDFYNIAFTNNEKKRIINFERKIRNGYDSAGDYMNNEIFHKYVDENQYHYVKDKISLAPTYDWKQKDIILTHYLEKKDYKGKEKQAFTTSVVMTMRLGNGSSCNGCAYYRDRDMSIWTGGWANEEKYIIPTICIKLN